MLRHKLLTAGFCVLFSSLTVAVAANQKDGSSGSKGDAAKGKETFEQCAICHNVDTDEKKMGPSLKGLFKRQKLANGKAVNEANVTGMINEGGNGMPPFADVLTKAEKDDIVAYLKSL